MFGLTGIEWLYLVLPAAAGYGTSAGCTVGSSAGANINARPPSWVFSVVWAILFVLIGISWVLLTREHGYKSNVMFALTVAGLTSWIAIYGCAENKKAALYILLVTLLVAFNLWSLALRSKTEYPSYLLTPYVTWLIFATLLNYTEVNQND